MCNMYRFTRYAKVTPADLPKPDEMLRRAKRWHPWRSVASWYLWRPWDLAAKTSE